MIYQVKVFPNSKINQVVKVDIDHLEIRTTAKAVDGHANQALIELISDFLPCKKSQIFILKGLTSRHKVIQIML